MSMRNSTPSVRLSVTTDRVRRVFPTGTTLVKKVTAQAVGTLGVVVAKWVRRQARRPLESPRVGWSPSDSTLHKCLERKSQAS